MPTPIEQAQKSLNQWWQDAGVELPPAQPVSGRPDAKAKTTTPAPTPTTKVPEASPRIDQLAKARKLAAAARTLDELIAVITDFDAGLLSDEARQAVISRGNPKADIMLIGEAPGRDEDKEGKPFVGRSGQLLDKMFAAIGMDETNLYITNGVFWRPKGNRTPTPAESALCLPFVERHIALIAPKILVTIGGSSTKTMLGTETGITRLRGKWADYQVKNPDGTDSETHIPLLPIYHPAFVLRKPATKREVWQDLQSLSQQLAES